MQSLPPLNLMPPSAGMSLYLPEGILGSVIPPPLCKQRRIDDGVPGGWLKEARYHALAGVRGRFVLVRGSLTSGMHPVNWRGTTLSLQTQVESAHLSLSYPRLYLRAVSAFRKVASSCRHQMSCVPVAKHFKRGQRRAWGDIHGYWTCFNTQKTTLPSQFSPYGTALRFLTRDLPTIHNHGELSITET
jgi:hypothetical protein